MVEKNIRKPYGALVIVQYENIPKVDMSWSVTLDSYKVPIELKFRHIYLICNIRTAPIVIFRRGRSLIILQVFPLSFFCT